MKTQIKTSIIKHHQNIVIGLILILAIVAAIQ